MAEQDDVPTLAAPLKMFVDGGSVIFSSANSIFQSMMNMGAQNVQDMSQTIQRGHAQVTQSINQATHGAEAAFKKPLVDMQQMTQGSALPVGSQAEPQKTMFSPMAFAQEPTRPAPDPEAYHPLTEDESDYTAGGFQAYRDPRTESQPAQARTRKTAMF